MRIETKRLILRPPKRSDWKDLIEVVGDLEVSKKIAHVPYPYKKKNAIDWINFCKREWKNRKKKSYRFFIELKSEKKVIGETKINNINYSNRTAATGTWFSKKYWRKGYITELKVPLLDFVFNKLKLRKIEIRLFSTNKASDATVKSLGFKLEGKKRKSTICKANGKIHDVNIYGLLKEEWKKIRPSIIKKLNKKLQ